MWLNKYILITMLLTGGTERSEVWDSLPECEAYGKIVQMDIYEVKSTECVLAGEEA